MTKRKFSKLMGKRAEYTAVKKKPGTEHEGRRTLFSDVRYRGKLYADHIWVKTTETVDRFEFGTKIGFFGIGYMYTDSHGVRKEGLTKCHQFHTLYDTYDKGSSRDNYSQMSKRKAKRKYS